MYAGRVFHATDALKKNEVVCLVVRAAGRISCLASAGIADCERRQRVVPVGSLSVALVEG